MLRLPWEVCKMTSGSTPISPPTLRWLKYLWEGNDRGSRGALRVPVLLHGGRRINDGAVHVKQESLEGDSLRVG